MKTERRRCFISHWYEDPALAEAPRCVAFDRHGEIDKLQFDQMIVRAYWQALQVDPALAASFRAEPRGGRQRTGAGEGLRAPPGADRPGRW
jgi:hypothetical protein